MSDKKFFAFLAAMALLALAVFGGGCGGGSSSDGGDPNGPENYRSEIAERLIAQDNVLDLAAFVRDSSMTAKKGDVLLYYPDNGEDITAYPDYLSRLNDALNDGAALAFVNITAEEIDKFTDKLELNLPGYLPDDATDEEKKALEDFYAFTVRLDSDDQTVENAYAYFGTDLFSGDMALTVYSGDQQIAFNPGEYEKHDLDVQYVDENGNILPAPTTENYDYAAEVVKGFQEWCNDLNTLKAVSEASSTAGAVYIAAGESSPVFPGVSATFSPSLFVSPRKFYNTDVNIFGNVSKKYYHERGVWRRDTSLNFNIVPVHSFSDGTDYYVFNVTGNTDPSRQYSHISFMSGGVYEGLGNKKPGGLVVDHILGYNYQFQYTVMFRSGSNAVGTLINSAPETLNDSKKISKGFTFALDGNISGGISAKEGLKGDASLKPSWKWESKEEYTVSDYVRSNISGGNKAGWKWEFQRPRNGDQGFGGVWLEDVPASGRSSVDLKSQFVMKVSKEEWKKYKDLKLEVEFSSKEGATEGGGAILLVGNVGRRDYSYDWNKTQRDYTLPRPPHIAVTQAKFNYKATASKGDTQVVTLQSEEDWTATANASWIHLTTSDNNTTTKDGKESVSGKATGASQAQIMVSVDAVTDGKPRGGKVVFKASDGETCTIDVLQAGR